MLICQKGLRESVSGGTDEEGNIIPHEVTPGGIVVTMDANGDSKDLNYYNQYKDQYDYIWFTKTTKEKPDPCVKMREIFNKANEK